MDLPISFLELFHNYWSDEQVTANLIIFLNLLGSLILGMALGFERTIRGRAAGLRTYGLVAAASCAMTVFAGYPHQWFGGSFPLDFYPDPTRVIQGIVTGVGFLGAGVIMKDGLSITGLSTAASIWMCSAIGILIGVGFYGAGIMLTLISIITMVGVSKLEKMLPQKSSYSVQLVFKEGYQPSEQRLLEKSQERGFTFSSNSINVSYQNGQTIWKYNASSIPGAKISSLTEVAADLSKFDGIDSFDISKTRM